ncbi:hypothetical protein RGQ13_15115 [Thalassotalea psychrophila]|uniref:Uncharacterized protein n=1 Tax=Thalassotalea psychrophila TaxID=3065647 RepID=A0ABY9TRM0_9GAMM|nr:hypothetical protein RGQ13_15115 [Colwelliaceae bacterium SQ149]
MLEFLVTKLIALMGPIATLSKEKRELKDSALRAISTALQETKIYYRSLDSGSERNQETEAQLVKYWGAAAIPIRHIDEELAMACEHKSEYWLNPDNWSNEEVKEFGIKLQDVTVAYRQLAMPSIAKAKRFKKA